MESSQSCITLTAGKYSLCHCAILGCNALHHTVITTNHIAFIRHVIQMNVEKTESNSTKRK